MADLLEIEKWACYDSASSRPEGKQQPIDRLDFFACRYCLTIRPAGYFSNAMMKGKRGKHGLGTLEEKSERFCIPCGVEREIYVPGTYIQFGGAGFKEGFVCRRCTCFNTARYCSEKQVKSRICRNCWTLDTPSAEQMYHIYLRDDFPGTRFVSHRRYYKD